MALIRCPECDGVISDLTPVCKYCGHQTTSDLSATLKSDLPTTQKSDLSVSVPAISLINCPACSKKISSQAQACPGCGHPIAKIQLPAIQPQSKVEFPKEIRAQISIIDGVKLGIGMFIVLPLLIFAVIFFVPQLLYETFTRIHEILY